MRLEYSEQEGIWHKLGLNNHAGAKSCRALVHHRKKFGFCSKCNEKLLDGFKQMSDDLTYIFKSSLWRLCGELMIGPIIIIII